MPSAVRAALGPTNTGKTHYALTRMMAHATGIIGFPLRLLARENYERLVKAKGARFVALITGEEKIIPHGAKWFSCTVEAMPLDRKVEFIAVDEIQLAADPDRGHVFTDRLLNARGTVETLFLGAETIRPLLKHLIPNIEIDTRTRLSSLVHTGATKLSKLPPRSAIVAFSMAEVYTLAEVIRRRRGGCAVIMGQLSPRTRNAQVELYQNREVDYLVATDAIGMGLNMDVDHVALAQLSKFDGTTPRPLFPQEIAQIAGRAGRGMRDGTFGTTADAPPLSETLANTIEQHRFEPIKRLSWRNSKLDFTNPRSLLASLTLSPPQKGLVSGRIASDVTTLESLILDPDIQKAARGREATALLWDVCQIPDFRKLGDDSHARLCAKLYMHLLQDGTIPPNWMDGHLKGLDKPEGDIDTLMQRLTGVRVCAYVASRSEWSRHSNTWQKRTREVEDRLSDALHERLTARFVDRRAATLLRRLDDANDQPLLSAVTQDGTVVVEGHDIGKIEGFTLNMGPLEETERALVLRAGRRALQQEIPRRIKQLANAPDSELALDYHSGVLTWNGVALGRLTSGERLLHPKIRLFHGEFADTQQRNHVESRLLSFTQNVITQEFQPLYALQSASETHPVLRGIVHRLIEDGGITPPLAADYALPYPDRRTIKQHGIIIGQFALFMPALLRPQVLHFRALLSHIHSGHSNVLPPTPVGRISCPWNDVAGRPGWVRAGDIGLRLDIAERRLHELQRLSAHKACVAPKELSSWFGIRAAQLPETLKALGVRHLPPATLEKHQFGPATPLLLLPPRPQRRHPAKKRPDQAKPIMRVDSPFAALAALNISSRHPEPKKKNHRKRQT
ncbi:DNA helicase [Neokomagataea thailandica NBRC 106555]|uniref:DEAD/DEAH box helicase n=3 Tax=Acetobacteraceae TaxID=433 RepID=A0A4Y6V8I5_9PROT|nr:DEAD/DEAH box helicase [Neokomagataea tanensis]GBR51681.1 DNA helicase [Neokomagataea thailandica NBRC 106555]